MERTFFNGHYTYVSTLGRGGMGSVYLVRNVRLGNLWAIKEILKDSPGGVDFLAEPTILKKLSHPALPRIVDIDEDEKFLYIVEDFIEGYSLDKQLESLGRFPESQVTDWAGQLCDVLEYLHSQKPNPIIYRDMKPANLIVDANGRVKLIDFGIAREYKGGSSKDTSYVGTRGYAAPEQYGVSQTDERTDIYGLGVTLYHLLTGKNPGEPPYRILPLREVDPALSEGIALIVAKCSQPNPADRYQNIAEVRAALKNIRRYNTGYRRAKRALYFKRAVRGAIALLSCASIVYGVGLIRGERRERYNSYLEQGYELIERYQYDDARSFFEAAARQNKSDSAANLGISDVMLKEGEYEKCIAFLKADMSKYDDVASAAHMNGNLGYCYMELGNLPDAVFYLERAVELDPSNSDRIIDLAVCHALQKNYDAAGSLIERLESGEGENPRVLYVEGQVLLARGDTERARSVLSRVAASAEDGSLKSRAYITLAGSYDSAGGGLERRIEVLEEALDKLPELGNIQVVEMLGESYFEAGNLDDSLRMFRLLLDKGYNRAHIYRNMAVIYQQRNDLRAAADILDRMRGQFETDYTCYMQLTYLHLEMESLKPEQQRDYRTVKGYYEQAVLYSPQGENTPELQPLRNMMEELRRGNWL